MKDVGSISQSGSKEAVAFALLKELLDRHVSKEYHNLNETKKSLYIIQLYQVCLKATYGGLQIDQIPEIPTVK